MHESLPPAGGGDFFRDKTPLFRFNARKSVAYKIKKYFCARKVK